MRRQFIIAFFVALGLGFVLLNPWLFAFYLLFLAFVTIIALITIVYSLIKRTKVWKAALLCLAVGYVGAVTSYSIQTYISFQLEKSCNHIITALYDYRDKHGQFPPTIQKLLSDVPSIRANYVSDTGLQNFTLYTRDFYGMPWIFSSKDSTWTR